MGLGVRGRGWLRILEPVSLDHVRLSPVRARALSIARTHPRYPFGMYASQLTSFLSTSVRLLCPSLPPPFSPTPFITHDPSPPSTLSFNPPPSFLLSRCREPSPASPVSPVSPGVQERARHEGRVRHAAALDVPPGAHQVPPRRRGRRDGGRRGGQRNVASQGEEGGGNNRNNKTQFIPLPFIYFVTHTGFPSTVVFRPPSFRYWVSIYCRLPSSFIPSSIFLLHSVFLPSSLYTLISPSLHPSVFRFSSYALPSMLFPIRPFLYAFSYTPFPRCPFLYGGSTAYGIRHTARSLQ